MLQVIHQITSTERMLSFNIIYSLLQIQSIVKQQFSTVSLTLIEVYLHVKSPTQ